jgi:hypothetical protein
MAVAKDFIKEVEAQYSLCLQIVGVGFPDRIGLKNADFTKAIDQLQFFDYQ